jgi:cytochrome c oxidase subunit III
MSNFITRRREPKRFALWLCIVGSIILFTVLLAAYLVRKGGADWQAIPLPKVFLASTAVILASSLTLHIANRSFEHERFVQYRLYMGTTLFLSVLFVLLQVLGWREWVSQGIYLQTNPSSSFLYILSGVHLLHILIGVAFLGIAYTEAVQRKPYIDFFIYSVNPPNQLRIKLITLYWHFVDVLWLVVFLFLLFHHGL